jgi:hypothetical protein
VSNAPSFLVERNITRLGKPLQGGLPFNLV